MAGKLARVLYATYQQLTNPLAWPSLPREIAHYLRDLQVYRQGQSAVRPHVPIDIEPIFFQRSLNSPFDTHYTYQAAWATRRIVTARPAEHIDVSSHVPFVAQLAAVLPVTQYEFHVPDIAVPGLTLKSASLAALPLADRSVDSLSCLHVIEHVGLGRYGDPLDPSGTDKALRELARVVAVHGSLYLSVPVGRARVAFNAHRVLDATEVVTALASQGLHLEGFALVDDRGLFHDPAVPSDAAGLHYGCGLFHLRRVAPAGTRED